jgi:outer membrane autotransporter protein
MTRAFGSTPDGQVAAAPAGSPPAAQRLGIWVDGTFDSGSHDGDPDRVGLNFGGTEVSAGFDYRASPSFAYGLSGGYAQDANDLISGPDQGTREYATDLAAYGALRLGRDGFLDALVGFGNLHFDTRRYSPVTASRAVGSRTGNDAFASLTAGQRFDEGTFSLSPYLGLTADEANLDAFTETGAGIGDLTYGYQAVREVSAVAGLRFEGRYGTRIGEVTPRLSIEFDHRLSATSVDPVWYADRPDTVFPIAANQIGTQPLTLGLGTTLRLPSGFLFDVDYRSIIDRAAVQHLLRIELSTKM